MSKVKNNQRDLLVAPEAREALQRRQMEYVKATAHRPDWDEYLESLDRNKKLRILKKNNALKHGLHVTAPVICLGPEKCPFFKFCPIPETIDGEREEGDLSDYPLYMQCVLEGEFFAQRVVDYMMSLEIDPADPLEMSVVNELALIDLHKNRALMVMSGGDMHTEFGRDLLTVDESVTGFGEGGDAMVTRTLKIHPLTPFLDTLERRREKWMSNLAETRSSKLQYALKIGEATTATSTMTILQDLKDLLNQPKHKQLEALPKISLE